jgi:hypothetical protein
VEGEGPTWPPVEVRHRDDECGDTEEAQQEAFPRPEPIMDTRPHLDNRNSVNLYFSLTPVLEVTPMLSRARPRKNIDMPKET